ncbi:hypothetical protein [Streptomyces sp. NPDC008150]|uniref:hypothetical protein n=1 Tax=Streptomyces sp. NPDC008150 TaxID=3364816 RepID=UPI0036E32838
MSSSSRLLCVLYVATSAGLAWTAVLELRYGPVWAAGLFAAGSIVPVVAVVRETVLGDQRRTIAELRARRPVPAVREDARAEAVVRAELDAACCERWWTSFGTDHDATCGHRLPRSSAA